MKSLYLRTTRLRQSASALLLSAATLVPSGLLAQSRTPAADTAKNSAKVNPSVMGTTQIAAGCDPTISDHIGCFTSVTPTAQTQRLVLPTATHTFQLLEKTGRDVYSGTNTLLPTNNDFTGYVPIGGSSILGYLSINHENTPGGVSMLNVHYNPFEHLWSVDLLRKVDYTQVVQSTRNCSGTVTPWGTVISSEESTNAGDANSDGYQDVGWNTEINPVTATIIDHDGNGVSDKLWAMGRINHENVCVASDSMTVYQGEDGGTGCVYKFVAAVKTRLDSGTLYVLKRTTSTSTTGSWVVVPNATQAQRNTTGTLAGPSGVGGTTWGGVEDCEIGPDGKVYFTEKNAGDIWRFTDNGTTVSNIERWVRNRTYPIATAGGTVNESFGVGIDNLAFDGDGNLWALQDGARNHIWVIRPGHTDAVPQVELFATTPVASESTGITFSPDYHYLFISFQHPNNNTQSQLDAAGSSVVFNNSATIVIARKVFLGQAADLILPVELTGFDLAAADARVSLSWRTGSEVENAGFEIERATEADTAFRTIVSYLNDPSLKGLGTNSGGKHYSFTDEGNTGRLAPGVYRYRLADVSISGERSVHEERSVRVEQGDDALEGLFQMGNIVPNPATEKITVPLFLPEAASVKLELYNVSGRQITLPADERSFDAGNRQIEIDISSLTAGSYYLKVSTPWGTRSREFIVTR